MKCHLNRMTAALLAIVLLTIPALAVHAVPSSELHSTRDHDGGSVASDVFGLWHRLLDGLSAVFAGDAPTNDPDDGNGVTGTFDPDGFTFVPPAEDGETNVTGTFDPDG